MARTKDFDENEVLLKAMNLFWYKGYNGTSMQDLVDGLGISRSSLYDTFGDKHSLFIKSLENYRSSAAEKFRKIVEQEASAKKSIMLMMDYNANELLKDEQHKGCFLVNAAVEMAPHDNQVNKMLCDNDRQMESFFYEAIKKGQASGEISDTQDAHVLAQFIINNVKGMRVTAKSVSDKMIFENIIALTLSALG